MLAPQDHISEEERRRGIGYLMLDAAAATAIGAINSGVVLLALALHIGASSRQIGILASIPLLTQMLQAPAVKLIERLRRRRLISVACVFSARLALPVYAIVPFIPDRNQAALVLTAAALLHYGMNAVGACSWNSWIRDFIPADRLGAFFSRRGLYGTIVSTVAMLIGAYALDLASRSPDLGRQIFSGLYVAGFCLGLLSTAALARVPEPRMAVTSVMVPLHRLLQLPLRDRNFRNVLRYVASWQFATNLAAPFFTVYIVRGLGYSIGFVLLLTVVSQLANIAVVQSWGSLSDRFTNKSVLKVASPAFLLCIGGMAFASEFDSQTARTAYLGLLHVLMGAAGAGVSLAAGNLGMKLSPSSNGTSYMAVHALVTAAAAGSAPIVGGWAADFFATRRMELNLQWISPSGANELFGLAFSHWEFFFLLSALLGLYALHRLTVLEETGSVESGVVVGHIVDSARRTLRNASSVAGLRAAIAFPAAELLKLRERRRFMLEPLFEQAPTATHEDQVGALLGAAFDPPPAPDDDMQALLDNLSQVRFDPPPSPAGEEEARR